MPNAESLWSGLRRLNRLLQADVVRVAEAVGVKPGEDLFRGLYAERFEALGGWGQAANGKAVGGPGRWAAECETDPLFRELKGEFDGFDTTDYGVLLLATAVEFDPTYERVFGYLQDDVTRRRPTVALAVDLLDPKVDGRDGLLRRLSDDAPLRANWLVELVDPPDGRAGLLGKVLRPDDQFTRRVYGVRALDRRLSGAFAVRAAGREDTAGALPDDVRAALEGQTHGKSACRLYLYGPDSRAKEAAADLLAVASGRRLLTADVGRWPTDRPFADTACLLAREAEWFGCALFVDGVEAFHPAERHRDWVSLTAALIAHPCPVVLSGVRPGLPPTPHPIGFVPVEVPPPPADVRVRHWREALGRLDVELPAGELAGLADRYTLTCSQIEQAVAAADAQARWRVALGAGGPSGPTVEEVADAARGQGGYELESLTHAITPKVTLDDLVVGADVREQLVEVAARVRHRDWVLGEWGFGGRQSYGNGVNALFAGPSGTGKTMAAEGLAHALGKHLHKIDLTAVVSKYIGETEQKLERVFRSAAHTQSVLFFDEADSLLGKRSEVRDAHDRYANIEVSYLLQRMESYDGLIILATNLPGNLDDAFLRRMAAVVRFHPPGPGDRLRLWQKVWPKRVPFANEPGLAVDLDFLAERFELTGGGVRNAALAAAFAAADRSWFRRVTMWDVLQAVRREFGKLGRGVTDADLGLTTFRPPPPRPPGGARIGRPLPIREGAT